MNLSKSLKLSRFVLAGCLLMGTTADVRSQTTVADADFARLSSYKDPGKSWQIAGAVSADPGKVNVLKFTPGTGILVNLPDAKNPGSDLYTIAEYGDADIDLEFMVARGSNSGVYLQGRYEVQLEDSWGAKLPAPSRNGGIYERWDDSRAEGLKGYDGHSPRQNASRAPGLWQRLRISFQAPRFDAAGKKTEHAKIIRAELNGVLIHENVTLTGPTRGTISQQEVAVGPLRFQGDHGPVAFRNVKISSPKAPAAAAAGNAADPIFVDAPVNTVLRSFMDLAGGIRVVKAVSAGSAEQVHYTYDLDRGSVVQVWRGGFLDATPMWDGRGNGTSRPRGVVRQFGKPVYTLARLSSPAAAWPQDTTGKGFRTGGYLLDEQDRPTFWYWLSGAKVTDASKALPDGQGISRVITVQNAGQDLYACLAAADIISEMEGGWYTIGDKAYYLRIDTPGAKPEIRTSNGRQELVVRIQDSIAYAILF